MARHSLAHSIVYNSLEKTIDTALSLDPAASKRIENLNGKTIRLQTRSPAIDVLVMFNSNGINLFPPESQADEEFAIPYDAHVESPSLELLKQIVKSRKNSVFLDQDSEKLVVSGDAKLVEECRDIFRDLDIDWEEALSHYIGDIAAHQIGRHTRGFLRWAKKATSTLKQDTEEYLLYETKTLVSDLEFSEFSDDVNRLAQAADELEARCLKLSDKIEKP